jgi:membrane-associated protease RseP (regulator of RpoE activity)
VASDLEVSLKVQEILGMAASLNLFLFLFNLVPLPPLDGGHAAAAIYEGARRRVARLRRTGDPGPVDVARLLPLTYVVSAVLLLSGLLVIVADFVAPISLGY